MTSRGVLAENQRQGLEQARRAVPREQIWPFVERRLEDVLKARPDGTTCPVGRDDEVRVVEFGGVVGVD